jgi:hypothetical protein
MHTRKNYHIRDIEKINFARPRKTRFAHRGAHEKKAPKGFLCRDMPMACHEENSFAVFFSWLAVWDDVRTAVKVDLLERH